MRALLVLALAGCDVNLFDKGNYPEGLVCGDQDSCPPGQECATAEHRCRVKCGAGGSCDVHTDIQANYECDFSDGYCRRRCGPMGGGMECNMLGSDAMCTWSNDSNYPANRCAPEGFCRPTCPCDRSFVCVEVGSQQCSIGLCYPPGEVPDGATIVDGFSSDLAGSSSGATKVTSTQAGSRLLRIDNNMLYWVGGPNVYACQLANCQSPSTLGTLSGGGKVADLIVTGGLVVFTDDGGNINSCPKDLNGCGGGPPTLLASGQSGAFYLASDGVNVYWTVNNAILKAGLAGGGPRTLGTFSAPVGGGIAVDGNSVYWGGDQTIFTCATDVCPSPSPVATLMTTVGQIAIDAARNAFFVDGDCIETCKVPGCTPTRMACNGGPANLVTQIFSDDTNLYWTTEGAGRIGEVRRCSIAGCNNNPTSVATMQNSPVGVAADNMWVYWLESGNNIIWSKIK